VSSHLLLTIHVDGQVVRVATDAVDVADASTGRVYPYSAGIDDLTVSSALTFLSTSGPLSVPVEAILPVDVAALVAAGVVLDGSAAELALWTEGDDYGRRIVLASATVTGAEWGELGEPVRFSIERAATSDAVNLPSVTEVIDVTNLDPADSLPHLAKEDKGQSYPIVFGSPGRIDGDDWVTGSQAVWAMHQGDGAINYLRLVVAGHAVSGSDYVWLSGDKDVNGHRFRVYNTRDGRGQAVAVVTEGIDWTPTDVLGSGSAVSSFSTDGDGYYYGLNCQIQANLADANPNLPPELYQPVTIIGSTAAPTTSAVFASWRGPGASDGIAGLSPVAGDVIRYVLQRAGVPVDHGRFEASARLLTSYRFDCVIDTPTPCLEWLRSSVYPLLPLSVESGPAGDYPVVWRYDLGAADVTAVVDADADPAISRASAIKTDSSQVANAFAIEYRYSVRTGSYTETVTRDASTCPYCAASERRWGRIERRTQTVIVYDAATAAAILAWQARAYTSPRLSVSYLVPSTYGLQRGQVVRLTDSLVSLDGVICQVENVQIDGTGIDGVTFRLSP